jgi:TolB protein
MDWPCEVEVQPLGGREPGRIRRSLRRHRRVVLALAAVAGAACLALLAAAQLDLWQPPPLPDLIAFVGVDGSLEVVAPAGGTPRTVAASGSSFQFPVWSPDGTRLAAIGTAPDGRGALYVLDPRAAMDGAPAQLPKPVYGPATSPPIYAYWSPDGRLVSFITSEAEGLALRVASPDDPGRSQVLRFGEPMYWQWIDPGRLLIHDGTVAPGDEVAELPLASAVPDPVGGPIGEFQAPGVSASLGYRAYITTDGTHPALAINQRGGTTTTRIPVAGMSALGWAPVGDVLAYTAPATLNGLSVGPLHLVDARSGSDRTLADGMVVAFFWAPDARTIAVIDLVTANGQTAAITPTPPPGTPTLRLRFVDVASGTVRSQRDILLPDILVSDFLPFFDQYALSHRVWSPASDAIVLPLVDDTSVSRITIVPADGSPSRVIGDGVSAFWSP